MDGGGQPCFSKNIPHQNNYPFCISYRHLKLTHRSADTRDYPNFRVEVDLERRLVTLKKKGRLLKCSRNINVQYIAHNKSFTMAS